MFGAHNLERFSIFQHAVLMNTTFMGKSVFADNRLIKLHGKARNCRHPATNIHDLGGINPGLKGHDVIAHF